MSYIIVWRNSHNDPFLETTANNFLEKHSSFEEAKLVAEETQAHNPGYTDYQIYEEANS